MKNKLFVGNLAYSATEADVRAAFEDVGTVTDVHVPLDRETGEQRGFAFVTMESEGEAQRAISALDGERLCGRPLRVDIATPPKRAGNRR